MPRKRSRRKSKKRRRLKPKPMLTRMKAMVMKKVVKTAIARAKVRLNQSLRSLKILPTS